MWSYYELTTSQNQADRLKSAGYAIAPGGLREVRKEAIAQHFHEQRVLDQGARREARRTALAALYRRVGSIFLTHVPATRT